MSMVRVAVSAAFLVAVAGARLSAEESCACPQPVDHATKELGRHESVFAGTVAKVEGEASAARVTFDVVRVYKGPRRKTLTLASSGTAGCAVGFEAGREYLVFADGATESLATDRCAGTRTLAQAGRSVRQLDLHAGFGSRPLRIPAE
ncbi:MAG: hypothetical protein ABW221_11265 [Vicinamibacteria bacterium]